MAEPLSFDVNLRNQYVILSNDGGGSRVTLFNDDGKAELTLILDTRSNVAAPCRIRCCGVYLYVMGTNDAFGVYKQNKENVVFAASSYRTINVSFVLKDISNNIGFNQIVACYYYASGLPQLYVHKLVNNNQVTYTSYSQFGFACQGANSECRLAVRDNYMVFSQGQTVRVYEQQ